MNENLQQNASRPMQGRQRKQKWRRPPPGVLKINSDGSFLPNEKAGSWGFLIRDNDGEVVQAGRGKINNLLSAFQAELIACLHGVQIAVNLGISWLILETDAQEVVRAICSEAFADSAIYGSSD
jgi:ribonuclease HI